MMYYLLFRYSLADQRKLYEEFKSKEELIKFIEEKKDEIEIDKIIQPGREFELNWMLRIDEIGKLEPQKRGRKKKEKIDKEKIEEEKAEPERLEKEKLDKGGMLLKRGDEAIEAAKKEQEGGTIKWKLCTKCEKNKIISVSKRKICNECLQKEKNRALDKKKKEILLSSESRINKKEEEEK